MVYLGDLWNTEHREVRLELEVSDELLIKLGRFFHIHQEVHGTHYSGKRVRIDAVLIPRDKHLWAGENIKLGLEIKRGKNSIGEASKHAAQSVDYANTHWDKYGYLYVFCFPDSTQGTFSLAAGFYQRFLGQLGVGFLRDERGALELRLKGHLVWS